MVFPGWGMLLYVLIGISIAHAQVAGEEQELVRLEVTATNAMAGGDPEGAALSIGRAALMASVLAQNGDQQEQPRFRILESLFRAREHLYRAYALFLRSGEVLPAPLHVCATLSLSKHEVDRAQIHLSTAAAPLSELKKETAHWAEFIAGSQQDFQCHLP